MRRRTPDEQVRKALPQPKSRRLRTATAAVCLLVLAGVSGIAYFLRVTIPRADALEAAQTCAPKLAAAQIGDSVLLGTYEQNGDPSDGAEPIEWVVLSRETDRLLLLSRFALDYMPFSQSDGLCTWSDSTLHQWLNGAFYTAAFSKAERTMILPTRLAQGENVLFENDDDRRTTSRVFLLSIAEADDLFRSAETRRCLPTPYAVSHGANAADSSVGWWLRTSGYDCSAAARILPEGDVSFIGQPAHFPLAVRPAIFVTCAPDPA